MALFAVIRDIPTVEVFIMADALAVAVIPENLPVAVIVVLGIRVSRMAKRHVLIRRLAALTSSLCPST